MRVTWIHPSWRDLVIEQLAHDDGARRRFLRSCGIDGALLALSSAGGGGGERNLPLLHGDGDWDALTECLHRLVPELGSDDLAALLAALAAAPAHARDIQQRTEAQALGEQVLGLVVRGWEARGPGVGVEALAAWFELFDRVPGELPSPHCEPALLRTAPTLELDLKRAEDCERLDDWLWLVEIARRRRPADLERVGFPDHYLPELTHLLRGTGMTLDDGGRIERIQRRLYRLGVIIDGVPPPHFSNEDVWAAVGAAPEPSAPLASTADPSLVARVLRDL